MIRDLLQTIKDLQRRVDDLERSRKSQRVTNSVTSNTVNIRTDKIYIKNSTAVPSTDPTDGGYLYTEAGALKYRGSSGTVSTIASA